MALPAWIPGRVLYQLHSLGAAGAAGANADVDGEAATGDGLDRLGRWLDHVADLGCGGVLLTPIFVSSTHGYDTVDPFRIDQRLGDDAAFDRFADDCHRRDLRLVLDGVFNHVGRSFPPFREVLAHGRSSPWCDWFRLDFSGDEIRYDTFEGHAALVALDHDNPAVLQWAVAVARHWLDRGADGWRLDAAYAIPRPFLRAMAEQVGESHPDALLFGEVIHGDYGRFVADSGLHSVTQYELHKALWSSLKDRNLFELAWALKRHREFASTGFAPVTFAGNHDVTRLASQLPEPEVAAVAMAALLTMPGIPCVYYGDELGWQGVKEHRAGGDDAIRPPLPDDGPPSDDRAPLLEVHRRLIGDRRRRPWLTTADVEVTEVANRRLVYVVAGDGGRLRVELDLDRDPGFSIDEG